MRAAAIGIAEPELERVMAWADQSFDSLFGAWNVLFTLDDARNAARSFLPNVVELELWGVGLHRSVVSDYCNTSAPPPPVPGYAPTGASGVHIATCVRPAPLANGGTVLGHEILIADVGCSFNSPESRHLDERAAFRAAHVIPNGEGLLDSFDDALASCRFLDSHASETLHGITGGSPGSSFGIRCEARLRSRPQVVERTSGPSNPTRTAKRRACLTC